MQVKFNSDTIDETDLLEETLRPRVASIGGTLEKVSLSGNHITPCVQVIKFVKLYNTKSLCCASLMKVVVPYLYLK